MSVLVSNGPLNLSSTTWYQSDAYNVGLRSGTEIGMSTGGTILPLTFANAGTFKGIILCFSCTQNSNSPVMRDITIDFQQNIASVWTSIVSTNYLATNIFNGLIPGGRWLVPIDLATPQAVTTASNTWRIVIKSQVTGSTHWNLVTSDGTNLSYITYGNGAVTPVSGSDFICCKDVVNIDKTFITKAYQGTGDTTIGAFCGWACKSFTPAKDTVGMLTCISPSAPYNFSLDGYFALSSHAGFVAGTIASPISAANRLRVYFTTPTLGTVNSSFIDASAQTGSGQRAGRHTVALYGAVPAKRSTTLAVDAAPGATTITVVDGTVFANNDLISIGKRTPRGGTSSIQPAVPRHTVTNVAGNVITFTPAILGGSGTAKARGTVVKWKNGVTDFTGYGIDLFRTPGASNGTYSGFRSLGAWSNFDVRGAYWQQIGTNGSNNTGLIGEETAWTTGIYVKDSHMQSIITERAFAVDSPGLDWGQNGPFGITLENVYTSPQLLDNYVYNASIPTAFFAMKNCFLLGGSGNFKFIVGNTNTRTTIDGLIVENQADGTTSLALIGIGSSINNANFWGSNAYPTGPDGALGISAPSAAAINCSISNCVFNNCSQAIATRGPVVGFTASNITFGNEAANVWDMYFIPGAYVDEIFRTIIGNPIFETAALPTLADNSQVRMTDVNVANQDYVYKKYGILTRTGYNLADTTVWTGTAFGAASAGQFGLRLAPNSGTSLLTYQDNNGVTTIGNVQNQTVTVTVRVYIPVAAYYAGTHTKPTLKVTYDGSTVVSNVAAGSTGFQQLQVVFTPTTTRNDITIEVNGATDATGTTVISGTTYLNNSFYLGEILVGLPSGISVDTSQLGSWTNALPLGYTKTFASPSSAWDEPTSIHTVAGSYGKEVNDIKTDTGTTLPVKINNAGLIRRN